MTVLLAFENVSKRDTTNWRGGILLDRVNLEIDHSDFVGIVGEARTGKSTLLRIAAGIEPPDSGTVRFRGRDMATMRDSERALLLRRSIGFSPSAVDPRVWGTQRSEVVVQYVGSPLISDGRSADEAAVVARHVLHRVGASACAQANTHDLTPAERTRVAIARALVREPELLLVDEPAATQSPSDCDDVRDLLRTLHTELGVAIVAASETLGVLRGCRRLFSIGNGELVSSDREGAVVHLPPAHGRRHAHGR